MCPAFSAGHTRRLQQLQDLLLGQGTERPVQDLALFHHHQGGDAHDTKLHCQLRFFIHIDLADLDIRPLCRDLIENGAYHPAGTAPGCPEIQQDLLFAALHFLVEVIFLNLYYRHIISSFGVFVCLYYNGRQRGIP